MHRFHVEAIVWSIVHGETLDPENWHPSDYQAVKDLLEKIVGWIHDLGPQYVALEVERYLATLPIKPAHEKWEHMVWNAFCNLPIEEKASLYARFTQGIEPSRKYLALVGRRIGHGVPG